MNSKYFKPVALTLTFIASLVCLYLVVIQMGFFTVPPAKEIPFNLSPDQQKRILFTLPKISPRTFALGPDRSFWIAGEGHLYQVSKEGKELRRISLPEKISHLASGPGKTLYGSTENRIVKISLSGSKEKVTRWAPLGNKAFITALCISGHQLFIADAGNKKLHCYSLYGKKLWSISGKDTFIIPSPYFDMASDGDGGVWTVNPGLHRIENYNREGRFLAMWEPLRKDGFLGCCNPARVALLPGGKFVTLEKGMVRCRIFSPAGHALKVVAGKEYFSPGKFNFKLTASDEFIFVLDPRQKTLYHFPIQ